MLVVGADRTTAALATIRVTNEDNFDSLMHPRDEVPLAAYSRWPAWLASDQTHQHLRIGSARAWWPTPRQCSPSTASC